MLDRGRIIDASLTLVREEGLGGLTMRALAARLDVTPMAIYRHVTDRHELVRFVANRIGTFVQPATGPDAAWDERARAWATAQRSVLRTYPGVAAWLIDNGPAETEAYRLLDLLSAALADAGFDDAKVARGTALIMSWTFSRIAIDDNADARARSERPDRSRAFLAGLQEIDATRWPTAARIGGAFFTLSADEIFESGLDSILNGLRP